MTAVGTVVHTRKVASQTIRAFYSRPLGWFALIVTSLAVSYGGGGVMFWFHAIYRGEEGPAINNFAHWFFDSSLGFAALTPALFFILPGALFALDRTHLRSARAKAAVYVGMVGVLFGVVTGPGPFMHDNLVGRTAPLGRLAVRLFGFDPVVAEHSAHAVSHSAVTEGLLQVVVGVPVYVATALLALAFVRGVARRAHR
jgi:hypothetical protein